MIVWYIAARFCQRRHNTHVGTRDAHESMTSRTAAPWLTSTILSWAASSSSTGGLDLQRVIVHTGELVGAVGRRLEVAFPAHHEPVGLQRGRVRRIDPE